MVEQNLESFEQIDAVKIADLILLDPSKDLFKQLIEIFDSEMQKAVPILKKDLENDRFIEISRLSHRLRSTSFNLGANRLGELFRQLEYMNYEKPDVAEIDALIQTVHEESQRASKKLHEQLNSGN